MKRRIILFAFIFLVMLTGCTKINNNDSDIVVETTTENEESSFENPSTEEVILNDDLTHLYKIAIAKSDKTFEIVSSEIDYQEALYKINNIDKDDFIIVKEDKIIYVKYGYVNLKTKNITENTYIYTNSIRNYINGSYGVDALFIDTVSNQYKIMISNTIGLVNSSEVELLPLAYVNNSSYYFVNSNNELVHALTSNIKTYSNYNYSGPLDYAPSYLKQNKRYYSYDGIYFYNELIDLVNDKRENTTKRAINGNDPHYNYFQYLPIRSLSSYTAAELNDYINYILNKRDIYDSSILVNKGENFINAQSIYQTNGTLSLVWAFHESGFGTSKIAKEKNNLFGMNAIDSTPYASAISFSTFQSGLNYHSQNYIINKYINTDSYVYNGTALGNKGMGFNVSYASDPYWGEKISAFYFQLDKYLGGKDYKKYQIGITIKPTYVKDDTNEILYLETSNKDKQINGLPLIIIGETDIYYKVLVNGPVSDNQIIYSHLINYDSTNNYGYVLKTDLYKTT